MGDSPLADGWPESESSFPDTLPFLEEDGIREAASWTELTEEAISDCLEVGALFRNDPNLEMLAWHAHRLIYRTESRPPISKWPAHLPALDSLTGAFYLLIALSGIDAMAAKYIGSSQDVAEFSHVTGPPMFPENLHGIGGDMGFRVEFAAQGLREGRKIFGSFP